MMHMYIRQKPFIIFAPGKSIEKPLIIGYAQWLSVLQTKSFIPLRKGQNEAYFNPVSYSFLELEI